MSGELLDPATLEYLLRGADEAEVGRVFGTAYGVLGDLTAAHRQVRSSLAEWPDLSARVPHLHVETAPCVMCALHDAPIPEVCRSLLLSLYALRDADEDWNHRSSTRVVLNRMADLDPDEAGLHAMFGPWWFDVVRAALDFEQMQPSERRAYIEREMARPRAEVPVAVSWLTVHVVKQMRDVTARRMAERAVSGHLAALHGGCAAVSARKAA